MYTVQVSKNRKYQTVAGPSSLGGAFDTYRALVNFKADKGTKVRLIASGTKVRVVRKGVAEQIHPRTLWDRPTVYLPTLDTDKMARPVTPAQADSITVRGGDDKRG